MGTRYWQARRWRVAAVAVAATALVGGTLIGGVATATAARTSTGAAPATTTVEPVVAGSDYLALGDSVSFGYRESNTKPAPDYQRPGTFVGYPEDVATALGLHVANAACPGETSASLINDKKQSNGCESSPGGGPGYRTAYPLHVSYQGSQLAYGLSYLESHPNTRLVTLMIGANDALLCEETTKDHCTQQFGTILTEITNNVAIILKDIRDQAHYTGQIVLVNYYSLDYANSTDNIESQALNSALDAGGANYDVEVAHGYSSYSWAANWSGGNDCKAGLLTQLTTGGCGIHPTPAGQDVLAESVDAAVVK